MSDHLTDYDRAGRITASVVGAILRHDPYHSAKWAWRVITGREKEDPNPWKDIQRGLEHEVDAVESLEIDLGVLALPGRFVKHPTLDYLGASPDGFIQESDTLIPVEAKCPRLIHVDIPLHYYDQVQVQLECCNVPYGYFVSWVADRQQAWKVYRDEEWWQRYGPLLAAFNDQYIVPDVEPPRAARRSKCSPDTAAQSEKSSLRAEPLNFSCLSSSI